MNQVVKSLYSKKKSKSSKSLEKRFTGNELRIWIPVDTGRKKKVVL